MKYLLRPLTKSMITKLQQCRDWELNQENTGVCPPEHFRQCLGGLYRRGFIEIKKCNRDGKDVMGVYLTISAIKFLEYLNDN